MMKFCMGKGEKIYLKVLFRKNLNGETEEVRKAKRHLLTPEKLRYVQNIRLEILIKNPLKLLLRSNPSPTVLQLTSVRSGFGCLWIPHCVPFQRY